MHPSVNRFVLTFAALMAGAGTLSGAAKTFASTPTCEDIVRQVGSGCKEEEISVGVTAPGSSGGTGGTSAGASSGSGGGGTLPPRRDCRWLVPPEGSAGNRTDSNVRIIDGRPYSRWIKRCAGLPDDYQWIPVGDDPNAEPPAPDPADFVPALVDEARRRIPAPEIHTPATDWDPDGYAYAQTPTFIWLPDEQWQPISVTATAGGVSATVTATPTRLDIDPGDGSPLVTCTGPTPAYTPGTPADTFPGCTHTYRHSSATAPDGRTWPLTTTLVWTVQWTGSTGTGGTLPDLTTITSLDLPVAEIQAIVTGGP